MNSPAPTSSTSEIASSLTTRHARNLPVARLSLPRAPSFNVPRRFGRDVRSAGSSPNRIADPIETTAVNVTTRRSGPTCAARGRLGRSVRMLSVMIAPPTRPRTPPASARITLSDRSCVTSRAREAPSAARMAISRSRDAARARSRLAMFAHAIRSTHTTAPNSSSRFLRTDWTTTSCSRSNRSDQLALLSGYAVAHSAAFWRSSVDAASSVTPSFRRPNTNQFRESVADPDSCSTRTASRHPRRRSETRKSERSRRSRRVVRC